MNGHLRLQLIGSTLLTVLLLGCGGEETESDQGSTIDSAPCDNLYRVRADDYATPEQRACAHDSDCDSWGPICRCFPYGVRADAVDQLPDHFVCRASELDFCMENVPGEYCSITHCVQGVCENYVGRIPNPETFPNDLAIEEGSYPFYPQKD